MIRVNELNLRRQIELLVNFKRTQLELKKLYRTRIEFQAKPILIESNSDKFNLTRLIFNLNCDTSKKHVNQS